MSESVGDETIETGNPENMGVAFGITMLSFLEREYKYFRFGGRCLAFPVSDDIGHVKGMLRQQH